jgi:MFS superfamily sulfate permease-like transporter
VFTGEVVRSNTSWTGRYRDKLEQGLATHGVYVIQLQGHIFFGNIQQIVKTIEEIIQEGYKKETIGSSPYTSPRPPAGPNGYLLPPNPSLA